MKIVLVALLISTPVFAKSSSEEAWRFKRVGGTTGYYEKRGEFSRRGKEVCFTVRQKTNCYREK